MKDRTALNSFLKDAGFSTAGDLVLLEPAHSETREVRSSEKAVVATISTRARDRQGDVIEPTGVRLDRFRKNPVVLYAHDYEALPVARSMWERIRQANRPTTKTPRTPRTATAEGGGTDTPRRVAALAEPDATRTAGAKRPAVLGDLGALVVRGDVELVAKPQFHLDTELSREVWALVEKGVLSAWSVGFIPEKWEPIEARPKGSTTKTPSTPRTATAEGGGTATTAGAERPAVLGGLGDLVVKDVGRLTGFRVTEWDLLEYSCVPVPANFQALTHELKERRITVPALVKSLAPLGFEAPDLVPTPIQSRTTKTPSTPRTATAEGGGTATPRRVAALAEPDATRTAGAKRPVVLGDLGALVVEDVGVVVSRAFDRWLERARGGE